MSIDWDKPKECRFSEGQPHDVFVVGRYSNGDYEVGIDDGTGKGTGIMIRVNELGMSVKHPDKRIVWNTNGTV